MSNILAARLLMAASLGFHIMFAVIGIGLPLMMVIAESIWLKRKNPVYLELAKRWAKLTGLLFAIGAVSGTVISFELGLLWPKFMAFAGPIFGMAFSLEGFAFFTEAIFLGLFLYGWEKLSPKMHLFSGMMVAFSAMLSGVLVTSANAWMNSPAGFNSANGQVANIRPFAAILNPATFPEVIHVILSAYQATAFAFAGLHAFMLLKNPKNKLHQAAFGIAFMTSAITAIIMPISGDISAKYVAKHQWVKLAAMEGQWETQKGAPLRIGGWPDEANETTKYALEIPKALSFLGYFDFNAEVRGLKEVSPENRPPIPLVHFSFQIMVGLGFFMMFLGILGLWKFYKSKSVYTAPWFLRLAVIAGPMGMVAMETGWIVTEVGRQPWIVYNIMRTGEGVTPVPHLVAPLITFLTIFTILSVLVALFVKSSLKEGFNLDGVKS